MTKIDEDYIKASCDSFSNALKLDKSKPANHVVIGQAALNLLEIFLINQVRTAHTLEKLHDIVERVVADAEAQKAESDRRLDEMRNSAK